MALTINFRLIGRIHIASELRSQLNAVVEKFCILLQAMVSKNTLPAVHTAEAVCSATGGVAGDVDLLTRLATSAFKNDPITMFTVGRDAAPAEYDVYREGFFRVFLREKLRRSERRVVHVDESEQSFAIWSLIGKDPTEPMPSLRIAFGMVKALGFSRGKHTGDVFDAMTRKHPAKPYVYLMLFGTHEGAQGKGLGSQVMRKMTAYLDQHGLSAYTESSNVRNIPFYQRHGFKILEQPLSGMPEGTPTVTTLWRDPKTVCNNLYN